MGDRDRDMTIKIKQKDRTSGVLHVQDGNTSKGSGMVGNRGVGWI